jgi:hypothetical protein
MPFEYTPVVLTVVGGLCTVLGASLTDSRRVTR